MMKLLIHTTLVFVVIILGFTLAAAIGVPGWAQGFFLIPAAYLFFHLSAEAPPKWWQICLATAAVAVFGLIDRFVLAHLPEGQDWLHLLVLYGLASLVFGVAEKFTPSETEDSEPSSR